ncbi:hypothetical protein N7456_006539 [Penicillium angulare]|uniref:Uncharacterized protein n=1 Tax=Penicillium angulare TaxID=116970 RepID=A0A9W9KCZ5_9EURO|nr:hypothetical protein N7456_006539 [Penicillium angulare]
MTMTQTDSNSIVTDQAWFGPDYTKLQSFVLWKRDMGSPPPLQVPVSGFGSVEVIVTDANPATEIHNHRLRLNRVLHCPQAICHVIGSPIWERQRFPDSGYRYLDLGDIRDAATRALHSEPLRGYQGVIAYSLEARSSFSSFPTTPEPLPIRMDDLHFRFSDLEMDKLMLLEISLHL